LLFSIRGKQSLSNLCAKERGSLQTRMEKEILALQRQTIKGDEYEKEEEKI
jgi:hypothetical protein